MSKVDKCRVLHKVEIYGMLLKLKKKLYSPLRTAVIFLAPPVSVVCSPGKDNEFVVLLFYMQQEKNKQQLLG